MSTMDGDQSSRFVSSLVKSIQALCNGYIDFSSSIEVIGHIHLNIDRSVKLDYVLTEEVSKSVSEGATVFASHSYHSQPPSSAVSKNASDSSSSNRNRSKQSQGDDGESAGFRSSTTDVHTPSKSDSHAQKRSSGHYGENSESSHSGSFVNTGDMLSLKQESPQKLCRTPESLDRRRKSAHGPQSQFHHHSPSPAVKRSRHSDSIPEREPQDFEVIEIKEEPDEAPAVFFGNSSSHMAAGQDLQTPDFSSVVMESLDRVSQVEGTDLVGEGGSMQQPFPVMMHSNPGMSSSSSSLAGPSQSDPQSQSLASTSGTPGGGGDEDDEESIDCLVPPSLAALGFMNQPMGAEEHVEILDDDDEADLSDLSLHTLEKGEGKNHRCIVCQRRHSQYLRDHPKTPPASNPYKRSKTSFRCKLCQVYLCAQEERQCWWTWHQALTGNSGPHPEEPLWLDKDQSPFMLPGLDTA